MYNRDHMFYVYIKYTYMCIKYIKYTYIKYTYIKYIHICIVIYVYFIHIFYTHMNIHIYSYFIHIHVYSIIALLKLNVSFHSGCQNKLLSLSWVTYKQQEFIFHRESGRFKITMPVDLASGPCFIERAFFPVFSHGGRTRSLSGSSFVRILNPSMSA